MTPSTESISSTNEFHRSFQISNIRTHIRKLNRRQLSEIRQTVVSSVLIHNEGDILHVLGTEPARHVGDGYGSRVSTGAVFSSGDR